MGKTSEPPTYVRNAAWVAFAVGRKLLATMSALLRLTCNGRQLRMIKSKDASTDFESLPIVLEIGVDGGSRLVHVSRTVKDGVPDAHCVRYLLHCTRVGDICYMDRYLGSVRDIFHSRLYILQLRFVTSDKDKVSCSSSSDALGTLSPDPTALIIQSATFLVPSPSCIPRR